MKRDFDVEKRNTEAQDICKKISAGGGSAKKPQEDPNMEKCPKCSKGSVRIDLTKEPTWTYELERSTVINVGGHTLLFICSECGSHIAKRGIAYCKTKYPNYNK